MVDESGWWVKVQVGFWEQLFGARSSVCSLSVNEDGPLLTPWTCGAGGFVWGLPGRPSEVTNHLTLLLEMPPTNN